MYGCLPFVWAVCLGGLFRRFFWAVCLGGLIESLFFTINVVEIYIQSRKLEQQIQSEISLLSQTLPVFSVIIFISVLVDIKP